MRSSESYLFFALDMEDYTHAAFSLCLSTSHVKSKVWVGVLPGLVEQAFEQIVSWVRMLIDMDMQTDRLRSVSGARMR